ncbi:MAG TPA: putative glycolipid-binding domain-containing protein [Ilumatobacteraceae bacterium]|nr:putative glycolipid-binding domain-containing protein [Ilumatobacteraceae bacterium]
MSYQPFSADGHQVRWRTWDGEGEEVTTITWENEGWTVSGQVSQEAIQYVIRLTATWRVSQFLLFRDLDEPDLWLGTDGAGHWGEVNGAHRPELDGCIDLDLVCTPFTHSLPIRRLPLSDGETAIVPVLTIDPETLATGKVEHRYTRLDHHRWQHHTSHFTTELAVDEFGLVLDYPDAWRRG